jgi:DNA-binding GntR family transcriptional regulator
MEERAGSPLFQTKTDAAFAHLLRAIMHGDLKPGDRILAAEWAAKAGVSQIPIREAIRRLEAQRLVRVDPHRGASVTVRTREQYEETMLIRESLETLAARKAVERSTPEELDLLIDELERLVKMQEDDLRVRNWRGVNQVSVKIHQTLYEASRLPVLIELIDAQRVAYAFDASAVPPSVSDQTVDVHNELLDALKTHDPEKVAAALQKDLRVLHTAVMASVFPEEAAAAGGHISVVK